MTVQGQTVGYVRVSTTDQNTDRQTEALGAVDQTFTDRVSGASRDERTGLASLLSHVRAGDTIRVASMDRLARSVIDLAQIVEEVNARGVGVEFVTERLTFTPGVDDHMARFSLHMLGAVAQLERSLIRERQREGIALARTRGAYRGRARALSPAQVADARQRVEAGAPKARVARDLGCSRQALTDAVNGTGAYATTTTTTTRSPR